MLVLAPVQNAVANVSLLATNAICVTNAASAVKNKLLLLA